MIIGKYEGFDDSESGAYFAPVKARNDRKKPS